MTNQVAITMLKNLEQSLDDYCELNDEGKTAFSMAITALELFGISEQLPSVQPELSNNSKELENKNGELISRQDAIDNLERYRELFSWDDGDRERCVLTRVIKELKAMPPVQPEPLSDAYMKAVWTWLCNYQIKAAELNGRYTPYEVLSWVANDWRKEHEGFD